MGVMDDLVLNCYGDDVVFHRNQFGEVEVSINGKLPSWEYNTAETTVGKGQSIMLMEWLSRATL